ncbi:hypothetical protein RRG08_019254 [Elysia crispata]|uniref:Uncharacterized protein n=1 Tax=Elysia crispata TaxID=231223 RepID=A0AAE0YV12_9GAST|nr:hypothetical protein RRG08_019254 [Elysia crispata]
MAKSHAVCVLLVSLMVSGVLGFYLHIRFPKMRYTNRLYFRNTSQKFYECLCSNDSGACVLQISGSSSKEVTDVSNKSMELPPELYEPTYECELPCSDEPDSINCVRVVKYYLQQNRYFDFTRLYHIDMSLYESCDLSCINIIWRGARHVWYYYYGRNEPRPGVCPMMSTISASTFGSPTTSLPSSTTTQEPNQETRRKQGAAACTSCLSISLGSTIPVIIILALVSGILLCRREVNQTRTIEAPQKTGKTPGENCQNGANNRQGERMSSFVDMEATSARVVSLGPQDADDKRDNEYYETVRPTSELRYTSLADDVNTEAEYGNMKEIIARVNLDYEDMGATYCNVGN